MVEATVCALRVPRGIDALSRAARAWSDGRGLEPLEEWIPGAFEIAMIGGADRAELVAAIDPALGRALATAIARALGVGTVAIVLQGRAAAPGRRLQMSASASLYAIGAEGGWTQRSGAGEIDPPPWRDDDVSAFDPDPEDLYGSLVEWLSDRAVDLLDDAGEAPMARRGDRMRMWLRAPQDALEPRLASIVGAIEAGARWRVEPQPDGRAMVVIDRAEGGVVRSFLRPDELAAVRARLGALPPSA